MHKCRYRTVYFRAVGCALKRADHHVLLLQVLLLLLLLLQVLLLLQGLLLLQHRLRRRRRRVSLNRVWDHVHRVHDGRIRAHSTWKFKKQFPTESSSEI